LSARPGATPLAVLAALTVSGALVQQRPAIRDQRSKSTEAASPVRRRNADRFDDQFRKYSKRYFGVGFDWRLFKAQGMAESNLDSAAKSWVGARGIMQLMPNTFHEISSKNPEMSRIDDPEWNIAAGIYYDRILWQLWAADSVQDHRREFMLASYNAGRGTIRKAQAMARRDSLDHRAWPSIERIAPKVDRWRYSETLGYVRRIDSLHARIRR
jgi:membrane-bound lytic murein transglycosylase F